MAHWTGTAKLLHWLMAGLLVVMVAAGLLMTRAADQAAATGDFSATVLGMSIFDAYQLHKSVGVTLFVLVVLRLVWRLKHPAPTLPGHMPAIEKLAARAAHVVLYGLMFTLPVSGWLMASASPLGIPTVVFGLVPLPHPLEGNADTEHLLAWVHFVGAMALMGLAALHVAAAFKHHFVDQDDVLTAMLPGRRRSVRKD